MKKIKFLILTTILALLLILGCESPTQTDDSTLWLGEATPNPIHEGGCTSFDYRVTSSEEASIVIINRLGQDVFSKVITPGVGNLTWNGKDRHGRTCGEGVYYYKLYTPSMSATNKLLIVK